MANRGVPALRRGRPGAASGRGRFDRKPGKCIALPFLGGAGNSTEKVGPDGRFLAEGESIRRPGGRQTGCFRRPNRIANRGQVGLSSLTIGRFGRDHDKIRHKVALIVNLKSIGLTSVIKATHKFCVTGEFGKSLKIGDSDGRSTGHNDQDQGCRGFVSAWWIRSPGRDNPRFPPVSRECEAGPTAELVRSSPRSTSHRRASRCRESRGQIDRSGTGSRVWPLPGPLPARARRPLPACHHSPKIPRRSRRPPYRADRIRDQRVRRLSTISTCPALQRWRRR